MDRFNVTGFDALGSQIYQATEYGETDQIVARAELMLWHDTEIYKMEVAIVREHGDGSFDRVTIYETRVPW